MYWSVSAARAERAALADAGAPGDRVVERVVVLLTATTLTLVLVWLLLSVLVCTIDAIRAAARTTAAGQVVPGTDIGPRALSDAVPGAGPGGLLRPRLVRALVSAVAGAAVASSSAAATSDGPDRSPLPERLDGLSLPDRQYGGVHTHRVAAGESLWSITADHLRSDADPTSRAVSRAWPRLHRLNRDRLGPDPDLIHPGTTVRLPAWATVPTRGATR